MVNCQSSMVNSDELNLDLARAELGWQDPKRVHAGEQKDQHEPGEPSFWLAGEPSHGGEGYPAAGTGDWGWGTG